MLDKVVLHLITFIVAGVTDVHTCELDVAFTEGPPHRLVYMPDTCLPSSRGVDCCVQ